MEAELPIVEKERVAFFMGIEASHASEGPVGSQKDGRRVAAQW
jgi:hypothetical protein